MVEKNWGYNAEANCPQAETEERWGVKRRKRKKREKTPEDRRGWKERGVREKDLTGELCVRALFT